MTADRPFFLGSQVRWRQTSRGMFGGLIYATVTPKTKMCGSQRSPGIPRYIKEKNYATAWAHRGNCLQMSGSESLCFMRLSNVCVMRPIGACDSLFDPPYSFPLQPCRHSSTAFQTVPVLNEWTPSVAFVVLVISIKWNCGGSLGICCRGSTPTRGL